MIISQPSFQARSQALSLGKACQRMSLCAAPSQDVEPDPHGTMPVTANLRSLSSRAQDDDTDGMAATPLDPESCRDEQAARVVSW